MILFTARSAKNFTLKIFILLSLIDIERSSFVDLNTEKMRNSDAPSPTSEVEVKREQKIVEKSRNRLEWNSPFLHSSHFPTIVFIWIRCFF